MAIAAGVGVVAAVGKAGFDLLKNAIDEARAAILLDNGTNFTFTHLKTVSQSGKINEQLPPTLSKGRYVMTTTGSSPSLKGTDGIITLQIDGTDFAVAFVWSVPLMSGSNRLAIGIYAIQNPIDPVNILDKVKNNKQLPNSLLKFVTSNFEDSVMNVELDYIVKIIANMNNHKLGRVMIQVRETDAKFGTHSLRLDKNDLIQNGESLRCTSIDRLYSDTKFRVFGVIEITNMTRCKLTKPDIQTDGGRCSLQPQDMEPFKREAVVVHKCPGTTTGSYGTLSFYIKEVDCRVVLMWSLPFNHDFFSNCLALDIRRGRELDHSKLFDKLYNRKGVIRTKYDKRFSETHLSEDGITLTASMTPSHRSHIKFKIEMEENYEATSKL